MKINFVSTFFFYYINIPCVLEEFEACYAGNWTKLEAFKESVDSLESFPEQENSA